MTKDRGPSEHEIQSQILDWLKHKRYFHWRNNVGASVGQYKGKSRFIRFGVKGSPDIYVLRHGKLIGIEVKTKNNYQSQEQIVFQTEFEKAGGKYLVAWTLRDVELVFGNGEGQ